MWNPKSKSKECVLKEALLRQLSHAVKEVQLYYSQTGETCSIQEGTLSLLIVLEAIFLHGLKRTLLESAMRSMSTVDDIKPTPSFYSAMRTVTHKNTATQIASLSRVTTDVGKCRAWIRLALNDAAVSSYLSALTEDRRISRYYQPAAFLRDREALDTASKLIDGLIQVPFNIPLNSSLLNTWSSEPLLMSGLWAPALRDSVQVAVDVAGGIEDDDNETCSIMTTASSSMRSLIMMDEAQALQLILGTPTTSDKMEQSVILSEPNQEVLKSEDSTEELTESEKATLQRSFSSLVKSVNPQEQDIITPEVSVNPFEVDSDSAIEEDKEPEVEISIPAQKIEVEDFSKMILDESTSKQKYSPNELFDSGVDSAISSETNKTMDRIVLKLQREKSLREQKFECADCQLSIILNFELALICKVTGEYVCESCHTHETHVVPARVIYNWDYTKYPIAKKAANYLASTFTEPNYDLEKLNPLLYNVVPELTQILQLRRQLKLLNVYLTTCKENVTIEARTYLFQSVHKYSLADLVDIPGGILKGEIAKLVALARSHVIGCWLCKAKGFICELCKDPQVIYPFDAESVYRCVKCKAVYHGNCLTKGKNCPKCQRRKKRLESMTNDEFEIENEEVPG